jgi:hypothetical protein
MTNERGYSHGYSTARENSRCSLAAGRSTDLCSKRAKDAKRDERA